MTGVIEIRTYRARPGCRDALMQLLRVRAFPEHRRLGMQVEGPFAVLADDETVVWLRGFPSSADRGRLTDSFYDGELWLRELEAEAMPLISSYDAVLVADAGLWDRWPVPA